MGVNAEGPADGTQEIRKPRALVGGVVVNTFVRKIFLIQGAERGTDDFRGCRDCIAQG